MPLVLAACSRCTELYERRTGRRGLCPKCAQPQIKRPRAEQLTLDAAAATVGERRS